MSLPRIWVIIPTFNALNVTRNCLADLSSHTYRNLEVVVSDSGSTDETCDVIRQEFSWVHIVHGNSDWWWTKATNEGIKYALIRAATYHYIMTLNNDVAVPDNYISEMVRLGEEYRG